MWNRVLCGQGFPAMCHVPSLDNVVLIDFCSAMVALFCENLGVASVPIPSVLAIVVGYTFDSMGSLWLIKKLGSFSDKKGYSFNIITLRGLCLGHRARPARLAAYRPQ